MLYSLLYAQKRKRRLSRTVSSKFDETATKNKRKDLKSNVTDPDVGDDAHAAKK